MKLRIGTYILCLFLMIGSISGCAHSPSQGAPGGKAPAVVSVWYSLTGNDEQELLKQFDRINTEHFSEVIVKGERISEAEFVSKVWNLQAGGEGPEIIISSRPVLFALYEKGALSPVLAEKYSAYPAAKGIFTFNQQLFAAPFLTDVPVLFYRKDKVSQPPISLAEVIEKKIPFGVKAVNTGLLSPWWKSEGGSLTSSRVPALDSPANIAFLNKLLTLRSNGLLLIDQDMARFKAGDVGYLFTWASDNTALTKAGVDWGSISLNSLVTNGKVILDRTYGIANSSVKTVSAMEEPIRIVEEELLKMETQASFQKAGGMMPIAETFYEAAKAESLNAQISLTLKNAWSSEGYLSDWKLLALQDQAWQNIAGGAKIESELAASQQEGLKLLETLK